MKTKNHITAWIGPVIAAGTTLLVLATVTAAFGKIVSEYFAAGLLFVVVIVAIYGARSRKW